MIQRAKIEQEFKLGSQDQQLGPENPFQSSLSETAMRDIRLPRMQERKRGEELEIRQ